MLYIFIFVHTYACIYICIYIYHKIKHNKNKIKLSDQNWTRQPIRRSSTQKKVKESETTCSHTH